MATKKKRPLTPKMEKACRAFVETGSKSDAYRAGYSTGNMKDRTINTKAYVLFERDDIRARVAELQAEAAERNKVTIDSLSDMFKAAYDLAEKEEVPAAMVSAATALGRLHGIISDKGTVTHEYRLSLEQSGDQEQTRIPATRDFIETTLRQGVYEALPSPLSH